MNDQPAVARHSVTRCATLAQPLPWADCIVIELGRDADEVCPKQLRNEVVLLDVFAIFLA